MGMCADTFFSGIEHVAIASKDPKALAKWYCDTLGFRIVYESRDSPTTFVELGDGMIEIIEAAKVDRAPAGEKDAGLRHIAISVTDIHQAYEHLKSKKVSFKAEPSEKKEVWTVFFEDPENNLIHLIQRPKPL